MSVKAFELASIIERVTLGEKIRIQIECIEYCAKKLYVGTSDSFVIELRCENGRSISHQTQYKYLALKKPVIIIKAIFILERILCVCDSNLIILNQTDLEHVPYGTKLKNVNSLCVNENPCNNNPFSIQICVSRKRQLHVFSLTSEKMIPLKDISINEAGLSLSMDGKFICVGTDTQFIIVNWETNHIQDLCASDNEIAVPISKRITREEFLISGPGSLGLFVKTTGISEKPPLQWGNDIIGIAYSHPYILCLSDHSLSVYSVVDQQLKQSIPFIGGTFLDNFDGNILIASNDSIFTLISVPWERQVQMLLDNKKVKEALDLSKNWHQAGVSKEHFNKYLNDIKQRAGFIEFADGNFSSAKELFITGDLDVRELIYLYPDLLPNSSLFKRSLQHDVVDVLDLVKDDFDKLIEYKIFLAEYLEELRTINCDAYQKHQTEIDTSLIVLYSQLEPFSSSLVEVLSDPQLNCDTIWITEQLEINKKFYALGLYYSLSKTTYDKALNIWMKIETKELFDPLYPGLQSIAQFLSRIDDERLFLKSIDFVLEREQELGASVIINRNTKNSELDSDKITDHLQRYPKAEQLYLEHLVFECKIEKEKFHTHLAIIYIERIVKLKKLDEVSEELKELREKLQRLLRESSLYRIQLILGKTNEANLYYECAILYGKLGEHEKALTLLVHMLHDYKLAERYCVEASSAKTDSKQQYKLFHILLGIYLDKNNKNSTNDCNQLIGPALNLLNSEITEFDAIKVLQLIPETWSITTIEQFLSKSLRRSMHRVRQTLMAKGLVVTENRVVKHQKLINESNFILLNDDRLCTICKNNITEAEFLWYPPLGLIMHPHCGKSFATKSK